MFAPLGNEFGDKEKCPGGVYVGHLHGIRYIGKHRNKWFPDENPRHIGILIFEVDAVDIKGTRFTLFKRETWSANSKSNLRSKYAPALIDESFGWTDDDWSRKDFEVIFNARPCYVAVHEKGYIMGVRALPRDKQPLVPELEWPDTSPEDLHPLVTKERFGESQTRAEDYHESVARFLEPQEPKPGKTLTEAPEEAKALAEAFEGEAMPVTQDHPDDVNMDDPPPPF